jgi:ADP-heptose:LPS heptosyltransferase
LAFAGVNVRQDLVPKIYFSQEEERAFPERLRQWGVEGDGWIGVQADAGTEAKEWPLDNLDGFLRICEADESSSRFVFVGADLRRAQWLEGRLARNPSERRVSLVGKTDLRLLFYLIRSLRAFVGPDSGPTHVAAAFGRPTLFLASGTNVFEQWKPAADNAEFLRNPVPCAPCQLRRCPVNGHPCMSGIQPEQVAAWLKERVRG